MYVKFQWFSTSLKLFTGKSYLTIFSIIIHDSSNWDGMWDKEHENAYGLLTLPYVVCKVPLLLSVSLR